VRPRGAEAGTPVPKRHVCFSPDAKPPSPAPVGVPDTIPVPSLATREEMARRRLVRARKRIAGIDSVMKRLQAPGYPASFLDDVMRKTHGLFNTTLAPHVSWQGGMRTRDCVCKQPIFVADEAGAGAVANAEKCGVMYVVSSVFISEGTKFPGPLSVGDVEFAANVAAVAAAVLNCGLTVVFSKTCVDDAAANDRPNPVEALWAAMHPTLHKTAGADEAWTRVGPTLCKVHPRVPAVVYKGPRDRVGATPATTVSAYIRPDSHVASAVETVNADTPDWAPDVTAADFHAAAAFVSKHGYPQPPQTADVVASPPDRNMVVVMALLRACQATGSTAVFDDMRAVLDSLHEADSDLADFVRAQDAAARKTRAVYTLADNALRSSGDDRPRLRGANCAQCGCVCGTLNAAFAAARRTVFMDEDAVYHGAVNVVGCHNCQGTIDVAAPVTLAAPMTGRLELVWNRDTRAEVRTPFDVRTGSASHHGDVPVFVTPDPLTATFVGVRFGVKEEGGVIDLTNADASGVTMSTVVLTPPPGVKRRDAARPISMGPGDCIIRGCAEHWTWKWDPATVDGAAWPELEHADERCPACVAEAVSRGKMVLCAGCGVATARYSVHASAEMLETGVGGVLCPTCAVVSPQGCLRCARLVTPVTTDALSMSDLPWAVCTMCRPVCRSVACCRPFKWPEQAGACACVVDAQEPALRLVAEHDMESTETWRFHRNACCKFVDGAWYCEGLTAMKLTAQSAAVADMGALSRADNVPTWVNADAYASARVRAHPSGIDFFPCGCPMDAALTRLPQYVSCAHPDQCPGNPGNVSIGWYRTSVTDHVRSRDRRAEELVFRFARLPASVGVINVEVTFEVVDPERGTTEPARVDRHAVRQWAERIAPGATVAKETRDKVCLAFKHDPSVPVLAYRDIPSRGALEAGLFIAALDGWKVRPAANQGLVSFVAGHHAGSDVHRVVVVKLATVVPPAPAAEADITSA